METWQLWTLVIAGFLLAWDRNKRFEELQKTLAVTNRLLKEILEGSEPPRRPP